MSAETRCIDINADVGERPEALLDGSEEQLLRLVTSANIACGGHAGDASSMQAVTMLCRSLGVSIGAHPGYPDRQGFGRLRLNLPLLELEASLIGQVTALREITSRCGAVLRHVKPHGALYSAAAADRGLATTIARSVAVVDRNLVLVGLAGSLALEVWRDRGFSVVAEAFVDRRYEPDGALRSRAFPDALIDNPNEAAKQALLIARDGVVTDVDGSTIPINAKTICIHGDTLNAALIADVVRQTLKRSGVVVKSF